MERPNQSPREPIHPNPLANLIRSFQTYLQDAKDFFGMEGSDDFQEGHLRLLAEIPTHQLPQIPPELKP